ncbi:MAG: hypothetical protein L0Y58_23645 [Verrucomicrobia subdivision 3 bacterium]|nr:hypothetical protein [Limisphaerales bacterium]
MRRDKNEARIEYRVQQTQRAGDSPSLSDTFPELKSLSVDLGHFDSEGISRASQIKYMVNLKQARSVFRIDCANRECIGGDFDLSDEIRSAVGERRAVAAGELRCRGWLSHATIDSARCGKILRYKLNLEYV